MNDSDIILDLSEYTIELYIEKFGEPQPIGSGLLIKYNGTHLLISAYHVIDMEDERIKIENDLDEDGIPQDDMEGIRAKGIDSFFLVNNNVEALVWTVHFEEATNEPSFSDDIEWCVCKLSEEEIHYFFEVGKSFYEIDSSKTNTIDAGTEIIISGYPQYAQKVNQETYRSYKGELIEDFTIGESGLFRVHFDSDSAYCYELKDSIQIPRPNGISGMSGGGLWFRSIDNYIPLGIIIKQDHNYVEGYSISEILKFYEKDKI